MREKMKKVPVAMMRVGQRALLGVLQQLFEFFASYGSKSRA